MSSNSRRVRTSVLAHPTTRPRGPARLQPRSRGDRDHGEQPPQVGPPADHPGQADHRDQCDGGQRRDAQGDATDAEPQLGEQAPRDRRDGQLEHRQQDQEPGRARPAVRREKSGAGHEPCQHRPGHVVPEVGAGTAHASDGEPRGTTAAGPAVSGRRDERPTDPGRWPDAAVPGGRHPVAVGDQGGVIVVGVDGSAGSAAALDFALAEGSKRECTVEVVTAWLGSGHLDGNPGSDELADGRARVHHMQGDVVARCLEQQDGATYRTCCGLSCTTTPGACWSPVPSGPRWWWWAAAAPAAPASSFWGRSRSTACGTRRCRS